MKSFLRFAIEPFVLKATIQGVTRFGSSEGTA